MEKTAEAKVFEIAILARVRWDLHSLNNEGTVGNVTEPRTVVLADGRKTDGVSGEMLKHIHSYYVWLLAEDKAQFCAACRTLHPQKADQNPLIQRTDAPEAAMRKAIESCTLCDLHGFLVQRPPIARASTVEFGWAAGLPESTHRETHLHARHSMVGRTRSETAQGENAGEPTVTAQMVYHRPTRSGIYALVSVFQPWRIGLSEVDYNYYPKKQNVVDADVRKARYALGLAAYKAAFMRADGAMTSTRLPHVESLEGVVVTSDRNFPVPAVSPLHDEYREQVEKVAKAQPGLSCQDFGSLPELCTILNGLATRDIYTLQIASS